MLTPKWSVTRRTIITRDKVCLWCGVNSDLTVDHIIPREWRGNANGEQNLQVLCTACHNKKYAAEQFLVAQVMQERLTVAEAKELLPLFRRTEPKAWQRRLNAIRRSKQP